MYVYETVTAALSDLKARGFLLDFNIEENCIKCETHQFGVDEFEIVEVYRFEGDTDPADEAIVYAIESKTGLKGVLVNAFGIYADHKSDLLVKKLSLNTNK